MTVASFGSDARCCSNRQSVSSCLAFSAAPTINNDAADRPTCRLAVNVASVSSKHGCGVLATSQCCGRSQLAIKRRRRCIATAPRRDYSLHLLARRDTSSRDPTPALLSPAGTGSFSRLTTQVAQAKFDTRRAAACCHSKHLRATDT